MEGVKIIGRICEVIIGYNLVLPIFLFVLWKLRLNLFKETHFLGQQLAEADFAVIVTAYEQTDNLNAVVESIAATGYQNYLVYIVADKCDISNLYFEDDKVVLLRPEQTIASNTGSHQYAIDHFLRAHQVVTIVDSDNLLAPEYFDKTNLFLAKGYQAVQGLRAARNLDSELSRLDAARDIYYHFYDGKVLHELGSSATLAGSGMTFHTNVYRDFLKKNQITGAGFDKVLQHFLLNQGHRIAFAEDAVVFDEKTSRKDQLVKQRARWINTWFKYFSLGFSLLFKGLTRLNWNQFLFGLILVRPPLFIFIILSLLCASVELISGHWLAVIIWIIAMMLFVAGFLIALSHSNTDQRIYRSLKNIPKFIYLQLLSLIKSRHANRHSVSTTHYYDAKDLPKR